MKIVVRVLLILFTISLVVSSFAQTPTKRRGPYDFTKPQTSKAKPKKIRLYLNYSPEYDSNLLKYSQFEIDRFEHGTEPSGKETPISSLQDWSHSFGLRTSFEHSLFTKKKTSYGLSVKWNAFSNSSIFNHGTLWFKFQQEVNKQVDFRFEYSFMNDVALRNYTDRDTKEWQTAKFDHTEYRIQFPIQVTKPFSFTPFIHFRSNYYNSYFTEFDGRGDSKGFDLMYQLIKKLKLQGGYKLTTMKNIGNSQATGSVVLDPVSADSEYGDSSYEEDDISISTEYSFEHSKLGTILFKADFRLRHRVYTTKLSITDAPFHRGREHDLQAFGFELETEPLQFTSVSGRIEWEDRVTTSPNLNVSKYKNYKATRFSLTMSYRIF